ncbi:MFS transporter [Spirilliplanes yamanashiensis]|uniref:MFS transporter n=1 Tax=Spirilliplanes yamanashiensis TaxID=42233 RepID=A0A8J4DM60_9ACTN|nr:MFS transporter [Spirilliplanes yamanashiensis]MDP9816561.1 hypothetical protein [Spirilliplanes yamanashiensis]GIJ06088.1 MFS transporter [Spirilliplanes yamanashiensis]
MYPPAARILVRRLLAWTLLAQAVPLYPLYALLFADAGMSAAQISALLAVWSVTGIAAEVPAGALADRWSRRGCLVASTVLQAAGYTVWLLLPGFAGFAAGFVLWGLGGALASGAQEALLYDGLAAAGAGDRYARAQGRVTAAEQLAQAPGAVAAALLVGTGGYPLVGWASVAACLAAAAVAARLPEPPRASGAPDDPGDADAGPLRVALREVAAVPAVRGAALAAALVGGVDAIEEYDGLLAADWGLRPAAVPLAVVGVALAGAAGAALAGRAAALGGRAQAALLGAAVAALAAAGLLAAPPALLLLAGFYGTYQAVLVAVDARLQDRITGRARATVTSVASLGVEVAGLALFAAWALGGLPLVTALIGVLAVALPRLLRAA